MWYTFHLHLSTDADELDEEELPSNEPALDGAVQSVAEAYPAPESEEVEQNEVADEEPTAVANKPTNDVPEESPVPEAPPKVLPSDNKKTPIQHDEEDDEEDDEPTVPVRSSKRGSQGGATYFPVTFGSTNGGAIAIANSYSTGKGKQSRINYFSN